MFMARALAACGVNLALSAHPGVDLGVLRDEIKRHGIKVLAFVNDLRNPAERRHLVHDVRDALGPIDILINNAGVEFTSTYHALSEEAIREVLAVNLEAPMMLSRLVLPEMLQRKRGHIVNISSLAGKSGPAFQEPYSATKAALIAFTSSLRATYRNSGVSASVIVPGFVEAGIYSRLKEKTGCSAPALLGTSSPQKVAAAVVRAIRKDLPEILVNPLPVRPLLAFNALFPRAGEWVLNKTGADDFFRRAVAGETPRR